MWINPQESADLVKFTEQILNGKFHFLCGVKFLMENFIFCAVKNFDALGSQKGIRTDQI